MFLECTCEPSGDREGNKVLVRARQETALSARLAPSLEPSQEV